MAALRKTEVSPIDGTPVKRMFWSIISDYDLKTGLCELIDNAIDLWTPSRQRKALNVQVTLDPERQYIAVRDDAGGVKQDELRLLIAPGGSRNDPKDEVIGVFGVGGKRASIALGERVEIRTRYKNTTSYQLDVTSDWLKVEDWDIPAYAIPNISPGTTDVQIFQLRKRLDREQVDDIAGHLGETYAWFIGEGCSIKLNGTPIAPRRFDAWAYPPGFSPRQADFALQLDNGAVHIAITAGLILDRSSEADNYGVYIYCNHRLVVKELKTRDVGYFVTREAGVPHADASLCRAIVQIQGPAELMPWNSSKSGINAGHAVFQRLRPTLIPLVSYFTSLSRRLKHDWDRSVMPHTTGTIESIPAEDVPSGGRQTLPDLPRVNRSQVEHTKMRNQKTLQEAPWTVGLLEAMAFVSVVSRQRLDTKNRIALVLLDSTFEIALKEFIVHRTDLFPSHVYNDTKINQLFSNRTNVVNEVVARVPIRDAVLAKARHYYGLRNKLIHERATVGITDTDVENYKTTVEEVLKVLFGIRF